MASDKKTIIAFDLYDTLLSTASISKHLSDYIAPDTADALSLLWRRYQLEYTWRLNGLGKTKSPK